VLIKSLLDRLGALSLLLILSPFLLIVAVLILFKMGRPVIFTQTRPGREGRLFQIYKFRTMNNERDEQGELCADSQRLTPLGSVLRKLSIDELPQLINVLLGEMSFIGPRPLLPEYLELYSEEQKKRHNMKPGITGWAQVNGRNTQTWDERLQHDVWYVENWSLLLDFKIFFMTIYKVIGRSGISQEGQATMQPFRGSDKQS
jgi:lipopolysaccharide/colanic/teichoic acid biosynthesis glycosyltransferase